MQAERWIPAFARMTAGGNSTFCNNLEGLIYGCPVSSLFLLFFSCLIHQESRPDLSFLTSVFSTNAP